MMTWPLRIELRRWARQNEKRSINDMLYKFLCVLCWLSLTFTSTLAQSPYEINPVLDYSMAGGLTLNSLGAHYYQAQVTPLVQQDLLALDADDIWRFDRVATTAWRPTAGHLSDLGLYPAMIAPVGLLLGQDVRNNWGQHLLLYWETLTLIDGLTTWTKSLALRNRPFNYYYANTYPNHPPDLEAAVLESDARFSFFSGHTSFTAASSFFFAKTFHDYYPNSPARPWVWAGAALLPALVGYLRVRAGKHYPTDVMAGYLIGAAVGFGVPALHRRR